MGEINFLDTEKDNSKGKLKPKTSLTKKTSWSGARESIIKTGDNTEKDKVIKQEKRIKKSREEVLEMISKDNKKKSKKDKAQKNKSKSWLSFFVKKNNVKSDKQNDEKNAPKKRNEPQEKTSKERALNPPLNFADDSWDSPDVLETNLISGSDIIFFDKGKKYRLLVFTAFFSIFLLTGIHVGLNIWERIAIDEINRKTERINILSAQIFKLEKNLDEINLFQKKLHAAKTLVDQHVYWTNFFNFLEDNTISDIQYNNGFEGDISGDYTFNVTTNDFDKIAAQVKIFRANPLVNEAQISGGEITIEQVEIPGQSEEEKKYKKEKNYTYDIAVQINPKVFTRYGLEETTGIGNKENAAIK